MAKVLITGGSGFIGTNLLELYEDRGFEVVNIDIVKPKLVTREPNWVNIDILDKERLSQFFLKYQPTHVVHLAARTDLKGRTLADYSANFEGVKNLILAIDGCNSVVRTVFASSMLVCGVGHIPKKYDEYSPTTIYGESKVLTEKVIKNHPPKSGAWTIVRPTSIWGPWFGEPYRDFFELILRGRYANFKGNACTKTYGYIGNVVLQIDGILFADNNVCNGKVFYLGDVPPINISEWADEIRDELNLGPSLKLPFWLFKMAALCGDLLIKLGLNFPMSSFRLKNMTTDNILPLDDLQDIVGKPPFTRKQGIKYTLVWLTTQHNRK